MPHRVILSLPRSQKRHYPQLDRRQLGRSAQRDTPPCRLRASPYSPGESQVAVPGPESRPLALLLPGCTRKSQFRFAKDMTAKTDRSQPLTRNPHLSKWVEKMAELTRPAAIHWVDGSQEEIRRALRPDGRERHVHQAEPGPVARLLLRPLRRQRCGARRRPHLHLLALERRRRPHQQLGKPVRDAAAS